MKYSLAKYAAGVETAVPFIPESAPFNAAQRGWLNGYLAGLFSGRSTGADQTRDEPAEKTTNVTVLYGTETGNSATIARKLGKDLKAAGFQANVADMAGFDTTQLADVENLVVITSTYGDGEPPAGAQSFHAWLHGDEASKLEGLNFTVFALGDSNYIDFCRCGKEFDERLERLGGTRLLDRVDCDVEFEEPFAAWKSALIEKLRSADGPAEAADVSREGKTKIVSDDGTPAGSSPKKPLAARLLENRLLNGEGSAKETRHIALALDGSTPPYQVGDALGVLPVNCPAVVESLLHSLNFDGEEAIACHTGEELPLRLALQRHYEIRKPSLPLAKALAEKAPLSEMASVLAKGDTEAIKAYLEEREILDLLLECPGAVTRPAELPAILKKLTPRLYSISSSPKAHPGEVHLTVGVVRYRMRDRECKGVCSTFLGERAEESVPVFIHRNENFRLPDDTETDIIMVGPGTGIAPFRAFLEDRRESGGRGRNWLFFGDRNARSDFLYRDEMEAFHKAGVLNRLDLAFSRDQKEKIYVQHRIKEHARDLWDWLQNGARLYVCGDAARMAKDIDTTLREIAAEQGGMGADAVETWIKELKSDRRYLRDVY